MSRCGHFETLPTGFDFFMTERTRAGRRRQRRTRGNRSQRGAWFRSFEAFRYGAASIHAVVFRVGTGRAFLRWALLPRWVRLTFAGAALVGSGTAACGDPNLDAIKMPSEDALGGSPGGSGGTTDGESSGSGGTGGRHPDQTDTGGSGGQDKHPSGGNETGGNSGVHPWDTGGATSGGRGVGGEAANGGRGVGGEAANGGRGVGGEAANGGRGTGGGMGSGGAVSTGGKEPWLTGGTTGSSTGGGATGGGGDIPSSNCPVEGVPDNGDPCRRSSTKPCQYGNGGDTALCYCFGQKWSCFWPCPRTSPTSASDCSSKEGATCRYDTGELCYCAGDSSWVCADTESDAGAAGASGAGGTSGAAGSASGAGGDPGVSVPPSDCPAIDPWELDARGCDQYARGTYCEYGPSWWCLCTGDYGWHCALDPASQNTQAMQWVGVP
jgi:hypothetical protein